MNTRVIDATLFVDSDDSNVTTSSGDHNLIVGSDTIKICNTRNVTLTGDGTLGECCFRSFTILGVTTWYWCVCVGTNQWRGTALSNLPL